MTFSTAQKKKRNARSLFVWGIKKNPDVPVAIGRKKAVTNLPTLPTGRQVENYALAYNKHKTNIEGGHVTFNAFALPSC